MGEEDNDESDEDCPIRGCVGDGSFERLVEATFDVFSYFALSKNSYHLVEGYLPCIQLYESNSLNDLCCCLNSFIFEFIYLCQDLAVPFPCDSLERKQSQRDRYAQKPPPSQSEDQND